MDFTWSLTDKGSVGIAERTWQMGRCHSVAQSCQALRDPTDCSTPGFPVLYHLLEFAQTHVCWVGDATQPSHLLLPPSPFTFQSFPASGSFPMSQLFTSGGQVLELHRQHQSFWWIFRVDFLYDWLVWSPCGPRDKNTWIRVPLWCHKSFQTPGSFLHCLGPQFLSLFSRMFKWELNDLKHVGSSV